MKSNRMRYVSRERIEQEIELQRIKREGIKPPRKKNMKKETHKRKPYKPRKAKTPIDTKKKEVFGVELILGIIREHGTITRKGLVNITKLPRTTVYDGLAKLEEQGLVEHSPMKVKGKRGRPLTMWRIK